MLEVNSLKGLKERLHQQATEVNQKLFASEIKELSQKIPVLLEMAAKNGDFYAEIQIAYDESANWVTEHFAEFTPKVFRKSQGLTIRLSF